MIGPQRIAPGVHPVIVTIGQAIRNRGMTLTGFAAEAGIERANLYKWLNSTHQPTLRSMEAVANVLGLGVGLAPLDPRQRAHAMAEFLRSQGWCVAPPDEVGFW